MAKKQQERAIAVLEKLAKENFTGSPMQINRYTSGTSKEGRSYAVNIDGSFSLEDIVRVAEICKEEDVYFEIHGKVSVSCNLPYGDSLLKAKEKYSQSAPRESEEVAHPQAQENN